MATVRIYGKELERWTTTTETGREIMTQIELAYRDYDSKTCELLDTGSEDFSRERYHSQFTDSAVWTWDGIKRNKGGHRWFEFHGFCQYRPTEKKAVKEYLQNKYKAALLQLR